jgi:hypothetical protein
MNEAIIETPRLFYDAGGNFPGFPDWIGIYTFVALTIPMPSERASSDMEISPNPV